MYKPKCKFNLTVSGNLRHSFESSVHSTIQNAKHRTLSLETKIRNLSFFSPDENTFEAMTLCRNAVRNGGNMPIILNGANEEAVALFLENKIKFLDIISIVKCSLEFFPFKAIKTFDDIYNTDTQIRKYIKNNFENMIK